MSIATEITRLQNAKAAIKTAIEGKGVTVPDATLMDGMAALIDAIEAGGGGGDTPSFLTVYTSGTFTPASDITAYYNVESGSGKGFSTEIEAAVKESGKTATNCFAVMWDSTTNSSVSTLADSSFMYGAAMLNQSGAVYANSGFTDYCVMAKKSSAGASFSNSTNNISYNGNLISEIGWASGAYYRAGRTYTWLCVALVK